MDCTRRFGCTCSECLSFTLPPPSISSTTFSSFRDDIPFSSSSALVEAVDVLVEDSENINSLHVTKTEAFEVATVMATNDAVIESQYTQPKVAAVKGDTNKGRILAQKKAPVTAKTYVKSNASQSIVSATLPSSRSEAISEPSSVDDFSNVLPTLTLYAGEDAPLPGAGRGTYKFSNSDSASDSQETDQKNTLPAPLPPSSTTPNDDATEKQAGGVSIVDPHASIPLADRLASKNSSLKRSAVTELIEATKRYVALPMVVAPTDDQNRVFFSSSPASVGGLLSSLISDGNALVSEAGVALVAAMCFFFPPGSRLPPSNTPQGIVLGLLKGSGKDLIQKISTKAFSASRSLLIDAAVNTVSSLMALEGVESGLLEMLDGLRTMPKPKVVKCSSRVLVSVCEAGLLQPSTLSKGCLGPGVRPDAAAFTAQLPTLLLSADKLILSAGIELSKAFLKIFPRDVEKMCIEYGKKAGGFSPELVSSILSAGGISRDQTGSEEASAAADGTSAAKPTVIIPLWDRLDAAYLLSSPSQAVDISKAVESCKLEATFSGGKSAPKWGDKVKAINLLISAIEGSTSTSSNDSDCGSGETNSSSLGHIRVAGDSHTFASEVATLRKGIKDSNANVAAKSMQALASFASRMRGSFSLSAKQSLGDVLSRLKEKSRATVAASSTCIKAFVRWDCVSIEDVISEVLPIDGAFASSSSPAENESWKKSSPELKANLCAVVCATLISPITSPPHIFSSSTSGATGGIISTRIRYLARLGEAAALDPNAEVRAHGEKLLASISRRLALASKKGEAETALSSNAELAKVLSSLPLPARDRVVAYAKSVCTDPTEMQNNAPTTTANSVSESASVYTQAPVITTAPTVVAKKAIKKATGLLPSSTIASRPAALSSTSMPTSSHGGAADAWYENTIVEEQGFPDMSGDEALESLLALPLPSFSEAQSRGLGSQQWKERRDAISAFGVAVCSLPGTGANAHANAAISVLAHKTGGFKGLNNPNVLVACATAIEAIARACTSSSNILRRTARVVLDGLIPYTKEKKGSEEIGSMAYALARVVGPNFVASRLYALSGEEKATPGVKAAANERIGALICGYGVGRLAAGPAMRHLAGPSGIQSASLPVKTAAIRALCHLHRQLGPPLLDSLKAAKNKFNLGDMLIKTIVSEFEKSWTWSPGESYDINDTGGGAYDVTRARAIINSTNPSLLESNPPIVTLHGEVSSVAVAANEIGIGSFASSISCSASALLGDAAAGKIGGASGGIASSLVTQTLVDVMSLLPRTILDDLEFESAKAEDAKKPKGGKSEDMKPWQVRMKAVETVQAALSQACSQTFGAPCVSPTESILALAKSLKKTLSDSQANTRPKACAAVSELAKAVGSPGMLRCGALKLFAPCLLDQLGDKKAGLREAVLVSLDALIIEPSSEQSQSGGAAAVFSPSFCAVVEAAMKGSAMATNVGGARDDVLCWIARHSAAIGPSQTALTLFQQLASRAVDALGDRSPAARAAASDLVAHVVRIAGVDSVKGALEMLKPAQRLAIEGSLEIAIASGKAILAQTLASKNVNNQSTALTTGQQQGTLDANEAIAQFASSTIGGRVPSKKAGTVSAKSSSSTSVAATATSESYALFMGQSAAKEARMSKSNSESTAVRFNLRLGSDSGSSDAMLQQKQILRLTQNDWIAAKCASASLMSSLFAEGDTSSEKQVEAMKWITQQLMQDCTAVAPAATSPTLDFVRNNSDLLFKYIAAQLWEPRGKPAALAAAQILLDRILSLFSQRGWALAWLEGEVLLPALCERAGSGGGVGSSSADDKASGLIVNTILLLRTCVEYAPRGSTGVDSALSHILERHIYSRILDNKVKQSSRVSLCSVGARLMRAVNSSGASHSVTLRRSIVVQLVRLCERDGMQSRDSPLQSVEVRTGLGELLSELFAQLGGGGVNPSSTATTAWPSFWKLATIDAKAATNLGLPVGVTLEVEARLKSDIEKKWMPSWIAKRNRDVENEARFVSPGLLTTRAPIISTAALLPCDDEIAAALNQPAAPAEIVSNNDALPLSPQHLTSGIRRSSIEKALMAAVEDEANAAATAAALSAGEKAVAAIIPPLSQFPRNGVVWRSNAALSSTSQLPSSPVRPIARSDVSGNVKPTMIPSPVPSAMKRLRAATGGAEIPVLASSRAAANVLLLSAGPVPQFPTIPAGVSPSCPVDVCSGLVNLRSACKRVGDVLGLMSVSGPSNQQQQQQQHHTSSVAYSTALAPAMNDAAASLESLESSIRSASKMNSGPSQIASAKALCENASVIVDSLVLAWRILPSSPTVLGAGASSPQSRGAHVAAAVRAMAMLPALSTLLLAQVPDFAKCVPETSAHSLLSAIEYTHARQAHAHARSVHEGIGRALMAAVYHLKRVTVAAWFLFAMKTTAAWSPESPVDPAPLPFNSRRTRNLRSLMRRLCSYEFRLDRETSALRKEKWVSSQAGPVSAPSDSPQEDLVLLARAFAYVFDDKIISPRANAVVFAADPSVLQVGSNGEIPTAFASRSTLGCECDAEVCASIVGAITNVRDLFAGVVGQTGLLFSPALTAAGLPASSASPQGPSVLRRLYHTFLSAMAAQQGVSQLCDVKAWEFDPQGAEAALARANMSNMNLNNTMSSVASLDAAAMSIIPSTPALNRTGSALGATTSSSSITSPTSAFTMELVGSVTSFVTSSALLPFNDAAEAAAKISASGRQGYPLTVPSTTRKQPVSQMPFSSPTPNTLPGMGYDDMALAAATPMPLAKNTSRMAAENINIAALPTTSSKLRKPITHAAAGPITTPAALRKAPASIIVPLGIAIAAQGDNEANGQSLSRQLELVSGEDVTRPDVKLTSVANTAAPRLAVASVPPTAPVVSGILPFASSSAILPSADECRAAAGLLHPSLASELSAALEPCLLAANTLSSSTTAPSPPPPWKTHAVPLIAALVSRATSPGAAFGMSLPFKGTGRDAVITDPITAALYVSVCDAGVTLTSQKVLFSNLNLYALKNGTTAGGNPDSIPLGKTPLFVFAKYVTALSTTSTATSSLATSNQAVRQALGATTTQVNVPPPTTTGIKIRPQIV